MTTEYTYDIGTGEPHLGNLISLTAPRGLNTTYVTTYNYTTDGNYSQNAMMGQPILITDNLSQSTHLRYDERGNCTSIQDAENYTVSTTYNIADQLLSTEMPATGQSGNGQGHIDRDYLYIGGPLTEISVFDEGDHVSAIQTTVYTYGNEGELLAKSGDGEAFTKQYDALYRLVQLQDGNSHTTTYSYDNVGNLTQVEYPGGELLHFTSFDDAGRILQREDGNSVITNYTYNDAAGLLTNIAYPASTSLNVTFTHDSDGRVTEMDDGEGTIEYSYDDIGKPLSVVTQYTGLPAQTVSYEYNQDGSRAQMATTAGNFTYEYDEVGRLIKNGTSALPPPAGRVNFCQLLVSVSGLYQPSCVPTSLSSHHFSTTLLK